jgi:deoxyribose-phosphate aldolase
MAHVIKAHHLKTGKKTGLKPAGGIVTADDALIYYAIVKEVLGEAWLTPSLFRLGASRLANNLLTELSQTTINYFSA